MRLNVLAIAAVISLASAVAGERTLAAGSSFPAGPFSGRCGDDVQCRLELTPVGSGYDLSLRVADAMNFDEIVCVLEADLVSLAPDVLVTRSRDVKVVKLRTGEIVVSGLPNDECSGAAVNGSYEEYLDE